MVNDFMVYLIGKEASGVKSNLCVKSYVHVFYGRKSRLIQNSWDFLNPVVVRLESKGGIVAMNTSVESKKNYEIKIDTRSSIIFVYLFLFFLVLTASLYLTSYQGFNLLAQASFQAADKPWLPEGSTASPLITNHFFGDFYLPHTLANFHNPYSPLTPFMNILPLGLVTFNFLGIFSVGSAFIIYTAISLGATLFGIWKILSTVKAFNSFSRIMTTLVLVFASMPVVIAIDRGAYVLLTVGLLSIIISGLLIEGHIRNSSWILAFLFAFALSSKLYLVAFLAVIFLIGNRKLVYKTVLLFVSLNVILSFQFGGPAVVVKQMIYSYIYFDTSKDPQLLLGSLGFIGGISNLLNSFSSFTPNEEILVKISWIPGVLFYIVTFLIFKYALISDKEFLVFGLSTVQYFVPISYSYTGVWASVSSAIALTLMVSDKSGKHRKSSYLLLIGCLMQIFPFQFINSYRIIIPVLWFLIFVFFVLTRVFELKTPRNASELNSSRLSRDI